MSKHRAFASSLDKHGWKPVLDNGGRQGSKFNKPLVGPASQAVKREARKVSGALLNGGQFNFFLTRNTFGAIRDLFFRFRVTCGGGAARVAPVPFWFTRIEAYNAVGSALLQTWYPDQIFAAMASIYGSQTRAIFAAAGFRPENGGRGPAMASGEQRHFYGTLDLGGDIMLTFYTAAAPIVTTISSNPVINIAALSIMVNSEIPSSMDIAKTSVSRFLARRGATLTAGQPSNIELRSVTADVAAILLCVLSNTSTQANEALRRYVPIEGAGAGDGKLARSMRAECSRLRPSRPNTTRATPCTSFLSARHPSAL